MLNPSSRVAATIAVALLVSSCLFARPVGAATVVGGTTQWTFAFPVTFKSVGIFTAAQATFQNHFNSTVLGLALLVLHNNLGQCVYITTSTISLTPDQYGTVYLVISGVNPGQYSATIFVMSQGGVAISNSTTIGYP